MHVYIYDSFLNQGKYEKVRSQIETRITDLGLNGKIARLGLMKNVRDVVSGELRRGAKTIVAVGNDDTVRQILPSMVGSETPLGIIPIDGKSNLLADMLGIPDHDTACDILSARRIERLDVGYIGEYFFISSVYINSAGTMLDIEGSYSIEAESKGKIYFINLKTSDIETPANAAFNPKDSMLHALISSKSKKGIFSSGDAKSIFPFKKLTVYNTDNTVMVDDIVKLPTPVDVGIYPAAVTMIVGKNRTI